MNNESNASGNQSVRYDQFGSTDVYYLADLPVSSPGAGEVVVRVKAAGINPGETKIRTGALQAMFPSTFPSGQGSDFAGIVEAVGQDVEKLKAGDEVIGFSDNRNSQAQYVTVDQSHLTPKPAGVSWAQGGGLFVAGSTAYAGVKALNLQPGDLLIVAGAAGGVGSLAVQLAKIWGMDVIGLASPPNHDWLRKHGVTPVDYRPDAEKAVRTALAGRQPAALFDCSGHGYVELAISLGLPPDHINTIADFAAVAKYKVKSAGSASASSADVLAELAGLIDTGKLEFPVANTYPLSDVKAAYDELDAGHTHGKIVLIPA